MRKTARERMRDGNKRRNRERDLYSGRKGRKCDIPVYHYVHSSQ